MERKAPKVRERWTAIVPFHTTSNWYRQLEVEMIGEIVSMLESVEDELIALKERVEEIDRRRN